MRAAVIRQAGDDVVVEDRPRPTPGPGEVLIGVRACGVCGSDHHLQAGEMGANFPIVPGHEVAGAVEEVGEGVGWPEVGDRVGMPWLYSSCGHCGQCTAGEEVLCPDMEITGVMVDGGYADYMVAPASYVAPIPEALEYAEAAPLMCAGLTVFNALRNAGFAPGDRVAVIGLGGLGHLGVLYATQMGARVAVISTSPDKEGEARELGAEAFIANTTQGSIAEALQSWDGGANIVLATAPATGPISEAIEGLAPGGTLVMVGISAERVGVGPLDLVGSRKHVMGSPSGSRKDLRDALEFAAAHGIRPRATLRPLEEAGEVLAEMGDGRLGERVVLTVG